MNLQRTRAMARNEFRHILRDPRSLALALAIPLLLLLLFGVALSLDVDHIPLLIYDQDKTHESRELIERFAGSRYFQIVEFADREDAIARSIDSGQVQIALTIPHDYARRLLTGQNASVQVILDGSDSNAASIAQGYTESLMQDYRITVQLQTLNAPSSGRPADQNSRNPAPVTESLRIWYNSELQSKNYIVPGLVAVIMMIIAATLTSLTIAREWEMGTMEQLLSTPLRPAEIVLGKMLAYFAIGLVDVLISVIVGVFVFDVPFRGSYALLIATSCIFLFGALLWGIFVSAVARSQVLAYQMGMISSFLPAFLLSGFIYPVQNMPFAIQIVTRIVPASYFVTILKGIFLKGVGLRVLWIETVFLAVFATVMFRLATRKIGQKVA